MSMTIFVLLACSLFSIGFYFVGVTAAFIHIRRRNRRYAVDLFPAISLLKPVKGLEENLEQCLRSFFEQDYPGELEIVFASAQRNDPAMAVARTIAAEYPHVSARFVLTNESWGLNPKVSNLQGALVAARHDLVLQTDANVWAPRDYVRGLVAELVSEKASLVSCVVAGVGERSLGAAIENLQLSSFIAPACCAAFVVAGVPCVIGKSMLLRRSELRELGGLELVKDSLCEDYLLGRHYLDSGKKVILSATPIRNVNVDMGLERSLKRHARWLKMRAVIHPWAFVADLFANPISLVALTYAALDYDPRAGLAVLLTIAVKTTVDGILLSAMRGVRMRWHHVLCVPLKDVLMLCVWCYAIFSRSVEWRGIRFRIGPGSQLLPDEGNLPVRVLRRLLSVEPMN